MNRSSIFVTSLSDFTDSQFPTLEGEVLTIPDDFDFNQFFPLSNDILTPEFLETVDPKARALIRNELMPESDLVGVLGGKALNIFDKTNRIWVINEAKLGIEKF